MTGWQDVEASLVSSWLGVLAEEQASTLEAWLSPSPQSQPAAQVPLRGPQQRRAHTQGAFDKGHSSETFVSVLGCEKEASMTCPGTDTEAAGLGPGSAQQVSRGILRLSP